MVLRIDVRPIEFDLCCSRSVSFTSSSFRFALAALFFSSFTNPHQVASSLNVATPRKTEMVSRLSSVTGATLQEIRDPRRHGIAPVRLWVVICRRRVSVSSLMCVAVNVTRKAVNVEFAFRLVHSRSCAIARKDNFLSSFALRGASNVKRRKMADGGNQTNQRLQESQRRLETRAAAAFESDTGQHGRPKENAGARTLVVEVTNRVLSGRWRRTATKKPRWACLSLTTKVRSDVLGMLVGNACSLYHGSSTPCSERVNA